MTKFKKTFATKVAISFFFAAIFSLSLYIIGYEKILYYTSLINTTAVNKFSVEEKDVSFNKEANRLVSYPDYGAKFATLIIPAIDLNLPIFHGDSLQIMRSAVGHYAGSWFPGENATVLLAAHNTPGFFQRIEELQVDDEIKIVATYGTFTYHIYETKIVNEDDMNAFPFQSKKEILILYTCYPINRSVIGRKTERYVVYAIKTGESYE